MEILKERLNIEKDIHLFPPESRKKNDRMPCGVYNFDHDDIKYLFNIMKKPEFLSKINLDDKYKQKNKSEYNTYKKCIGILCMCNDLYNHVNSYIIYLIKCECNLKEEKVLETSFLENGVYGGYYNKKYISRSCSSEEMKSNRVFNKEYFYNNFDKIFAIKTTNTNCISYLNNCIYKADGFIIAYSKNKHNNNKGEKWNIFPACISSESLIDDNDIYNAKKIFKFKRDHINTCKNWEFINKNILHPHLNIDNNKIDFYYIDSYRKLYRL